MKKLFVLFFALSLFSCSKENEEEIPEIPVPVEPLIPLTMGNEWVYASTSYREDGSVWYTDTVSIKITEKKIIGDKEFSGIGGFFIRNVDSVTIERAYGDSVAIYFKKVKMDEVLSSYQYGSSCIIKGTYSAFAQAKNIFGYDCFLNEQSDIRCDSTIATKVLNYLQPGLGFVAFVGYNRAHDGSSYLSSEQKLISSTLK